VPVVGQFGQVGATVVGLTVVALADLKAKLEINRTSLNYLLVTVGTAGVVLTVLVLFVVVTGTAVVVVAEKNHQIY